MHLHALQTMHEGVLFDFSCGVQIMFSEKQFTFAVYSSIGCCSHTYQVFTELASEKSKVFDCL